MLRPQSAFFGNAGPLATFSAKIDLACLLNMVSDAIRSDLHAIREIRNEFAHQIAHKLEHTRLAFTAQHIRDKCLALRCVAHEDHSDARAAFTRACATLNSDFEMVKFMTEPVKHGGQVIAASEGPHGASIAT